MEQPKQMNSCDRCAKAGTLTHYVFTTKKRSEKAKEGTSLFIEIYRHSGTLDHSTTPGWMCHAVTRKQREELRVAWPLLIASIEDARIRWGATPVVEAKTRGKCTARLSRWEWFKREKAGKVEEEKRLRLHQRSGFRQALKLTVRAIWSTRWLEFKALYQKAYNL